MRLLQRKLGITAIYVTHDQEEANAVADRIAVLDQGRIQQIGTPVELYDRPANRFVATFLGTVNLIDGHIGPDGRFVTAEGFSLAGIAGPAGAACISIRPQAIGIGSAGSGIAATITEHEFLGAVSRYRMRAGQTEIVADVPHQRGAQIHAPGAAVGLMIDPRQVAALKADVSGQ